MSAFFKYLCWCGLLIVNTSCGGADDNNKVQAFHYSNPRDKASSRAPYSPRKDNFLVRYGGHNKFETPTNLSDSEWNDVQDFFYSVETIEDEIDAIKKSIAYIELRVAEKLNIHGDRGGNHRDRGTRFFNCIDEANNSTTYLKILEQARLLSFFSVGNIKIRGFVVNAHNTATIVSKSGSNMRYAVDSWFHDNGIEPEVVPLDIWQSGWKPGK
jgi:hypothetical protein